ncbi:MAG: hypothetical protein IKJ95_06915 [Bacteroidaceae bacterium]|nr:hypothetical protein [Bacteroidaceae bacterium]
MFGVRNILLFGVLVLAACHSGEAPEQRVPVAKVDDTTLYKDELDYIVVAQNHIDDSVEFMADYVNRWAMEELFYRKALENVASSPEIEKMVENYRRNLILNKYQEALITQHLNSEISDDDVHAFYEKNKQLFEADEAIMRGFLLKLPLKAPDMRKVRSWCNRKSPEDFEAIETYCDEHKVFYEYFMDDWKDVGVVAAKTSLTLQQLETRLQGLRTVEFRDKEWIYFVSADTMVRKGGLKPVEVVSDEIRELLVNSRKADFIKSKKKELYDEAVAEGRIKIHK